MFRSTHRRFKPEPFWRDLIDRWKASGQSVAAFCTAHRVSQATFYSWRKRLAIPTRRTSPGVATRPARLAASRQRPARRAAHRHRRQDAARIGTAEHAQPVSAPGQRLGHRGQPDARPGGRRGEVQRDHGHPAPPGVAGPQGRVRHHRCHGLPKGDRPSDHRPGRRLCAHRQGQPGTVEGGHRRLLSEGFGVILRKVWGGSRTWTGARAQAELMSVWRTCWQQGRSALDFLSQLLRGTPLPLALPP